jgi:hypothetical protein
MLTSFDQANPRPFSWDAPEDHELPPFSSHEGFSPGQPTLGDHHDLFATTTCHPRV